MNLKYRIKNKSIKANSKIFLYHHYINSLPIKFKFGVNFFWWDLLSDSIKNFPLGIIIKRL